jgi:hypothetical protein
MGKLSDTLPPHCKAIASRATIQRWIIRRLKAKSDGTWATHAQVVTNTRFATLEFWLCGRGDSLYVVLFLLLEERVILLSIDEGI